MAGTTGDEKRPSRAHNGPSRAAESGALMVLQLAERLPDLEDVREVGANDRSDLTQTEQGQLQRTEEVIADAVAAGDTALWVIAQAVECAARGRWWRTTHDSLTAYAEETVGRSAVYIRQLRMNAPLALETARRTGTVPKPSQIKATRKTEQRHGLDAAVTLYEAVRDIAAEMGGETTARGLTAVHNSLPEQLPEQGDDRRAIIEQAARHAFAPQPSDPDRGPQKPKPRLAGHWQIRLPESETESIGSASIAPASADTEPHLQAATQHTAVTTPHHMRTLEEALAALATIDEQLTSELYTQAAIDPTHTQDYERVRQHIIIRAAAIRAKALRAPKT
ncbi:hypothetical protein [Streptomyces montanisoli]|uniref:Uncharacterized protein n=1 Tax=Streptomyces montanisoli TaxID=2798581 RepID=A0A940MGV6_9ACTN|nr:hypothetical protein [Streptomyces montanisoli]MBP0458971.1 hypothetical protein [Streptomyces montanisoli]